MILKSLLVFLLSFAWVISSATGQEEPDFRKYSGNGLRLEIAPLGQDQVQAFFIGRDFSASDARFIAETGCIFRSAIGNAGKNADDPKVTVQLGKWQVTSGDKIRGVLTREKWAEIWVKRKVEESPKIAFHWSLFPTLQNYSPSDYNWGLISFALPAGTKFDLQLTWLLDGIEQKHTLKGLECGK